MGRPQLGATSKNIGTKKVMPGGIMGSTPGTAQQISTGEVRKLRQEIQNLRDANDDLKDELHEARQDFLLVR